eukprot:15433323-Alexandrium_andersonii.AAC.1
MTTCSHVSFTSREGEGVSSGILFAIPLCWQGPWHNKRFPMRIPRPGKTLQTAVHGYPLTSHLEARAVGCG